MKSYNIAAYISGSGSNLKSIIDSSLNGNISSKVRLVIANRDVSGLDYPRSLGIDTAVISRDNLSRDEFLDAQLDLLNRHKINLIILAGYLKKLPPEIVRKFNNRILNLHPALLPKFGGKGMHGMNVHRAVIESGEFFSGATVHFVDEIYDNGRILIQENIGISPDETPENLQKRVLEIEHRIYSEAIKILEDREE
jgi:phosphoribosylglycinamide formyltransferase 1